MERIASFCVDHTKLDRGMYLSRQDGDVLTWDIRMKKPNHGDYLTTGAAHTLEHLFATYARNSAFKDSVIYVGPMGCRTGFYLLTRGLTPAELDGIPEMRDTYPEFSQFKELPAWGFYIRHAKGITFDNVKFIAEKPGDYRPGLVTDDVQGLTLRKVEFEEPGANGKEQVFTYKTTGIVKE